MSTNPLLETHELPPFAEIRAEHVEPAVETLLSESREAIDRLAKLGEFCGAAGSG